MARIEIDPNYTSPTFPRATEGTDLFKKEDVQQLAAAVSTHVHDGVHGLPLTASSIPNGTITSAMIADGTIVAGDIADGAVTSAKILDGTIATVDLAAGAVTNKAVLTASITPSSTSATPVAIVGADVSLTTTGGDVLTFFRIPISHTAANVPITMYVQVDATGWAALGSVWASSAGSGMIVTSVWLWTGLSAGLHTWQIGWATGSGQMGVQGGGTYTTHVALELKR